MRCKVALIVALLLTASSLAIVNTALAQTRPSVSEFTLRYVDNSFDVPPTTTSTTDPYTGKTVTTTTPGYHVEKKSIEITITNQPFTPYSDSEGHLISLFYNVRFKGHFGGESDWIEPFYKPIRDGIYGFTKQNPQSNSGYTIISVPSEFNDGDVVDFQIQTLEGFHTPWEPLPIPMGTSRFTGKSSEWSSTQTITISKESASRSATPTQTHTLTPALTPTATPIQSPILSPTETPTPALMPSAIPTSSQAQQPTLSPAVTPTLSPTVTPSSQPSYQGVSQAEFYTTITIFTAVIVALAAIIAVLEIKIKKIGNKM